MGLSGDLISQFVKITNDNAKSKKETTVYGTTVAYNGSIYVKLDGSDLLTPISTTADMKPGERVTVMIKNHSATVTGNISSPSARTDDVSDIRNTVDNMDIDEISNKISEFEIIIADKVDTEALNAQNARIEALRAENVTIKESLNARSAEINELKAKDVEVDGKLEAAEADIETLQTTKLDVDIADVKYATVEKLDAAEADLHKLEATYADFASATTDRLEATDASVDELNTNKLDAQTAAVTYANIDFSNISKTTMEWFYANSGLIEDVVVGDGTITGNLVGVTIKGDLIEGNTIKADKLVIKGTDGLYYKLNTNGVTTEAEQTNQNSLNGGIITAKSITASKISVSDLVAFDATIGGFNITNNSIYSGTKETVGNTTRGIYLDSDGQMAVGDANNFIKYYKDTNGAYKLAISASSIIFAATNKSVDTVISEVQNEVSKLEQDTKNITIGGRNLLPGTDFDGTSKYKERKEGAATEVGFNFYPTVSIESGVEYTLSANIRGNANIVFYEINEGGNILNVWIKRASLNETEYNRYLITFVVPDTRVFKNVFICTQWGESNTLVGDWFEIEPKSLKLEKGNRATDWTPAPEDLAASEDLEDIRTRTDELEVDVLDAESLISQLSDSISMLVTDGNGTSLMTQTEEGWKFSTAEIQSAINSTSEGLDSLVNELGDTNGVVDVLKQAVDDLGTIAEYVKIGTYEDEPCVELGERDSDFRLVITNTRIMFMEGSDTPAYINNRSLHITKAVIEEELQQGNFVWKIRQNGNMGLVWKGEA